jgi:hypothetical protein
MKRLKCNFTNPEQSKRLLELGVPAWTADLYFYEEVCISDNDEPSGVIPYGEAYEDNSKETMFSSYVELPCWSVGRLIEIFTECSNYNALSMTCATHKTHIEQLIELYEVHIDNIDFKKLD